MSTHDPEAGSASAGDGDPNFHHNHHPPARKKRTQTLAFASLLVFVATLQMLVYHMHHVRHHVGVFRRSARERERVVLPRDESDEVEDWALAGGDVGGGFRREGGGTGEEFERGVGRGGGGGGVRFESRGDDGQGLADDARGERRGGSAGGGSLYNADR